MNEKISVQRDVQIKVDVVSFDLQYVGEAPVGAGTNENKWKIKRIQTVGNIVSIQFAQGSLDFINKWDDRTIYTYI